MLDVAISFLEKFGFLIGFLGVMSLNFLCIDEELFFLLDIVLLVVAINMCKVNVQVINQIMISKS